MAALAQITEIHAMSLLTERDCPGVPQKTIDSINELTDSELEFHINLGNDSKFGPSKLPVVKLALQKRRDAAESRRRHEDVSLASEANRIAESALEQAKLANRKSDQARIWSAAAILVSVLVAVVGWVSGDK